MQAAATMERTAGGMDFYVIILCLPEGLKTHSIIEITNWISVDSDGNLHLTNIFCSFSFCSIFRTAMMFMA